MHFLELEIGVFLLTESLIFMFLLQFSASIYLIHPPKIRLVSTVSNQIKVVVFMCTTLGTRLIFTKKSNIGKWFFDICNAVIAQCCQKLDVTLVDKVI